MADDFLRCVLYLVGRRAFFHGLQQFVMHQVAADQHNQFGAGTMPWVQHLDGIEHHAVQGLIIAADFSVDARHFDGLCRTDADLAVDGTFVQDLRGADINQEVYGLPEWLPALQAALLNESATLFRRKYYQNGSHAGFILYMTDAAQNEDFVDDLRTAMKSSKGPGNFRNLFMYAPNGKKDGIQLIPISEVAAKDDFGAIKNISRDDQLAMLRIPPQLTGVVPHDAGGFGSVRDATQVWAMNELEPEQARLLQINEWLGEEVVAFRPYEVPATEV